MNLKPAAACSPVLLLMLSGGAHAAIEPFSLGATETIEHDSNIARTDDANKKADWFSTTEFRAALDQAVGRNQLTASAAVNFSRYADSSERNSTGYRAAVALNWSTIGDLSGSIGADTSRRQYLYGLEGDVQSSDVHNLETDNHVFANVSLGGASRWTLFSGFDAVQRNFSAESFASNEERQWQVNGGTRYSTSPDLNFGLVGSYTRGRYPHYPSSALTGDLTDTGTSSANFSSRSLNATTHLQATGNSSFNASVGYTTENSDLQPAQNFVNGSIGWKWTPPSHFSVGLSLTRSSDGGANASSNLSALNERSLNNAANLSVNYSLTAKIGLTAAAQYTARKYSDVKIPVLLEDGTVGVIPQSGSNHSSRFALTAHYQATRTLNFSCNAAREVRSADASIARISPAYTDNSFGCSAAISID